MFDLPFLPNQPTRGGALLVSSQTVAPAVRMQLLVAVLNSDGDNTRGEIKIERHPVVAIENRYFNLYRPEHGRWPAEAFTHAEAIASGWARGRCVNEIEPIIAGGPGGALMRLSEYEADVLVGQCPTEIVACPWPAADDGWQLDDAETKLRERCEEFWKDMCPAMVIEPA